MDNREIKDLQDALTVVAKVCDKHKATPAKHKEIAESLKLITDTLSKLLREKMTSQEQK
jgi:Ni,Fe-hydrogenase III large subunit